MKPPRFEYDNIPTNYWNEVYRDCALIDAVREVAEELKKLRESLASAHEVGEEGEQPR